MPGTHRAFEARVLLAVSLSALAATTALGTETFDVRAGDTVIGATRTSDELHAARFFVPSNSKFIARIVAPKGSKFGGCYSLEPGEDRPRFGNYHECATLVGPAFEPVPMDIGLTGKLVPNRKLRRTGLYHLVFAGNVERFGEYKLRTKIKPGRKITVRAKPSEFGSPREVVFGAFAGYEVSYRLKWKGGAVGVAAFTGPEDVEMTSTRTPTMKANSMRASGFTTHADGEYRIALDIPPDTFSWSVQIQLKGKPSKGTVIDRRPPEGAPLPELVFDASWVGPHAAIRSEVGAPNQFAFSVSSARGVFASLATGRCLEESFVAETTPGFTRIVDCPTGDIRFRDFAFEGDRVTGFTADVGHPVIGAGTVVVRNIHAQPSEIPGHIATRWTETRTYARSGNTHTLEFEELAYVSTEFEGDVLVFDVRHTDPVGTVTVQRVVVPR